MGFIFALLLVMAILPRSISYTRAPDGKISVAIQRDSLKDVAAVLKAVKDLMPNLHLPWDGSQR